MHLTSMALTDSQLSTIVITERVCSVLSLIGTTFIIITFLTSRAFGKSINRLVFYASIGNVLTNIGTLISVSGITIGGALCQFQGFLIQMFMPADALWTLAMACNVYLTFFHKYDAKALRSLEWKYLLICYGLPFIPAFVYFFVKTQERGPIYGDAVLWCWVDVRWDYLRVAVFYGPVWFVILITIAIYIIAGKEIFEKSKALRDFSSTQDSQALQTMTDGQWGESKITKEVHITSEPAETASDDASQNSVKNMGDDRGQTPGTGYNPYSVTIEIGGTQNQDWNGLRSPSIASPTVKRPQLGGPNVDTNRQAKIAANRAAFGYARVSLLFFCAILITWVPSTVNRVASLVDPNTVSYPLSLLSALVLPLQGFWNSIIYIFTSLPACRSYWRDIKDSLTPSPKRGGSVTSLPNLKTTKTSIYTTRNLGRDRLAGETESTKGFARS